MEIPHCTGISAYALPFMTMYAHKSHHWFLLQLKWCSEIRHLKLCLNLDLSNTIHVLFLHGYDLVQRFQSVFNSLTLFAKRPQTVVIQAGWSSFYFVYTIQSNCVNNMFVIIVLFVWYFYSCTGVTCSPGFPDFTVVQLIIMTVKLTWYPNRSVCWRL